MNKPDKKITLATCLEQPALSASDTLLKSALEAEGFLVSSAPWNGSFAPFAEADMVLIRSTWDYFDKLDEFYGWLEKMQSAHLQVENSPEILRWNACKDYLFELSSAGVNLLPTLKVDPTPAAILATAKAQNWHRVVLKCLASGGAKGLSVFHIDEPGAIEAALQAALPYQQHGLMLQPFYPQIEHGELSLLFFGGQFSHAVLKRPKSGDFRVQSVYGGAYDLFEPDQATLEVARQILSKAPGGAQQPPAYARIDGLLIDGAFQLMEMELTEPELMFEQMPSAAKRLAAVLKARLG